MSAAAAFMMWKMEIAFPAAERAMGKAQIVSPRAKNATCGSRVVLSAVEQTGGGLIQTEASH